MIPSEEVIAKSFPKSSCLPHTDADYTFVGRRLEVLRKDAVSLRQLGQVAIDRLLCFTCLLKALPEESKA